MKQHKPTPPQVLMIVLLSISVLFFGLWLIPEVIGVIDPATEDTFSEWVWDLPFPFVLFISTVSLFIGVLAVWAAGHFVEGWYRRKESDDA